MAQQSNIHTGKDKPDLARGRRWGRRVALWAGGVVVGLLVLVLLSPWWFPLLAGTVLRHLGVEVQQAGRQGWSHFELRDLRYHSGGIRLEAGRVVLPLPTAWVYWSLQPRVERSSAWIQASRWTLEVERSEPTEPELEPRSWSEAVDTVDATLGVLRRWLPPTTLDTGRIRLPGLLVELPRLTFQAGDMGAVLKLPQAGVQVDMQVLAGTAHRFEVELQVRPDDPVPPHGFRAATLVQLQLHSELTRTPAGWTLEAEGDWAGNDLAMSVDLTPDAGGIWARNVRLEIPEIILPAEALGPAGYEILGGRLLINGPAQSPEFDLALQAGTERTDLPSVRVSASGRASMDELELSAMRAEGAGLSLDLRDPLRWGWESAGLRDPVVIGLQADLAGQEYAQLTGRMEGLMRLTPVAGVWPVVDLALAGSDLEFWEQPIAEFSVEVQARGPELGQVTVRLRTPDGSIASLTAEEVDLLSRQFHRAQVQAEVTDAMEGLLGYGQRFTKAATGVTLSGDLTAPRHEGWLQIEGIHVEGMRELTLAADWQGDSHQWIQFRPRVSTAEGQLTALGVLTNRSEVELTELRMEGRDIEPFALRSPVRLTWASGAAPDLTGFDLRLERFEWGNARQSVEIGGEVSWPAKGQLSLALHGLDSGLLTPFVERPLPLLRLDSLGAEARWEEGPVEFGLRFAGSHPSPLLGTLQFAGEVAGGAEGLQVERFRLGEGDFWWASASGVLPYRLRMTAEGPQLSLGMNDPVHLDAELAPSPLWQRWMEQQLGVRMDNARSRLTLRGRPSAPEGEVRVTVGELRWVGPGTNQWVLPPATAFDLHATMRPDALRVESFQVELAGQPLKGQAEWPIPAGFWESVERNGWILDLEAASGHLELPEFPLASLPPETLVWLRPEGTVRAEVRLEPGYAVRGEVELTGLATRALPMAGPIRQIHGRILLEGEQVEVEAVRMNLGGAAVELSGTVDLAAWRAEGETLPGLQLRLSGQRVPLARQAGLVVRSDLDLWLRRAPGELPLIEGDVNIRRSFVLSDLDALFGGTVRTASRPPPFFSIEQEPFGSWRMNIMVRADETIHVRSPFYRGSHSLNLRLRGSLRDPLLTGDIQVDRASVVFPYSSMPIRQGLVTFTEQNPEAPRLVVTASSRAFGYDLRMEIGGTLQEPSVQLSSVPSLTSEEILLMITAGELPRNELQYSTGDRLAKLATMVGKDLLNKFGAQDASEERLILRSGEGISAGGRVTHQLEYRLTDIWSIVGEYDEFDDLNAGIKWRVIRR